MTKRTTKLVKMSYSAATNKMVEERDRVVSAAILEVRTTQCFTDMVFYGLPFEIGEDKPATRSIGFRRPNESTPAGCIDIARIPVSCLSHLQACRMLATKMENFPCFNCDAIS